MPLIHPGGILLFLGGRAEIPNSVRSYFFSLSPNCSSLR